MENILTERRGRVLIATINDPGTRNALNCRIYDGLGEVFETAADDGIGAVVLTGAEGFFSSGGNLHGLKERSEADYPTRRSSVDRLHRMILAMRKCPKPVIAAIEGGAAGAGASTATATACDLIVAAKGSYLSVANIKIGLTPDGGVTAFLGSAIPRQMLAEMVFTGDEIPVERLHQVGVINRLCEPDQALELAGRLADGPTQALGTGKRLIDQSRLNELKAQLDQEAEGIATALGGAEGAEGINAFLEKRKPDFGSV